MQALEKPTFFRSPAGRPMPLTMHDGILWIGCWDTARLYAVDPKSWSVRDEIALPGKPYGLVSFHGALRATVSINEEDDRYIYEIMPGQAVNPDHRLACPNMNGSHLASDGNQLFLVQQTNGRILALNNDGSISREITLPTRCAGFAFADAACYIIAADEEFDELHLATLDLTHAAPQAVLVAPMGPEARGLACDSGLWWTSYRETNQIVSFHQQ